MESLNHLKHIPCPSGSNCKAYKCLFQHKQDQGSLSKEANSRNPTAPPPPIQQGLRKQGTRRKPDDAEEDTTHQLSERPQKRLKASESAAGPPSASRQPHKPNAAASAFAAGSENKAIAKSLPNTPAKHSQTGLGRPRSEPRTKAIKAKCDMTTGTASRPSAVQKSAETLKPRMVHPPPATFDHRLRLLKLLHDQAASRNSELAKDGNDEEKALVLTAQELITRACDEEEKLAKEKSKTGYVAAMRSSIQQLKKLSTGRWKTLRENEVKANTKKSTGTGQELIGEPLKIETGLTIWQELEVLKRILTPLDELTPHGYVTKAPSEEDIVECRKALEINQGWEKCVRCERRFQVFPGRRADGLLTSSTSCVHHPGKVYYPSGQRSLDGGAQQPRRYMCCNQGVNDSAGCTTGDTHVFKVQDAKRLASLLNFATTPVPPPSSTPSSKKPDYVAVCFDCEMGYTSQGLEVIRLTATAWPSGDVLLDVLVKPYGELLDLNTDYSGVSKLDFANAPPWTGSMDQEEEEEEEEEKEDAYNCKNDINDPRSGAQTPTKRKKRKLPMIGSVEAARGALFALLTPDTPLMGHALENDLNSMRIIHPAVVDTVLLYPTRRGLPSRFSLKTLARDHLRKEIQAVQPAPQGGSGGDDGEEDVDRGHDSAEDARIAGELIRLRVKTEWESMKRTGWTIGVDGALVPPGGDKASP